MTTIASHRLDYFNRSFYSRNFLPAVKRREKNGFGFLGALALVLIFLVSLGYFTEINSIASLGYEAKEYQKSVDGLRSENQKMRITIAESASFKNIGDVAKIEKMNLVNTPDYQYLAIPSSSFAKR